MNCLRRIWNLRLAFLAGVLVVATVAFAQEITGDIRGVVRDQSGAVVAGASVKVTNTDRNTDIRDLTTGSDGSYVAAYLPVGHYKVSVSAKGFATFTASDIVINVNDRRTVDAKLQVGSETNTVEVKESPVQVNLENSTASGLISGTQIRELSISTRNYEQLVSLIPGVSTNLASDQLFVGVSNPTGTSNQINFSINGNRPTQNNWTIDGSDNVDRGANLTLLNYPSIDSIAEFNVLRSNYLPEHGRSSSGEVTVITRSGTSTLHGSAYEFFRNDKLNANNFFNNHAGIARPELRWNDFGFTLGGPVYIPGLYTKKDKTFFFYSQEWRKIITYNTFTSSELPTAAEMQGTMPVPVCVGYDASGNCNSTTSQISNINPVAQGYIKDIYSKLKPNNPDNTLTWVGRNIFDYREENVRIDHNFSSRFNVFGRYLDDSIPTQEPAGLFTGLGIPGVSNTSTNSPGRNISAHATWTISNNLLADLGYAYSYGAVLSTPAGTSLLANSPDIAPTLPFGLSGRVPDIGFNDGQGIFGFGPYRDYNRNHNFFANVTKVFGPHSTKFGFSYNHYTKDENVCGTCNNGSYSFADTTPKENGPADGTFQQEWANFLLGNVAEYDQTNIDFRALVHQNQYEMFAQDEWRIRPNFTLDYGVRYSLFLAPTYGNGLLTTFDPAAFDPNNVPQLDSNGLYVTAPSSPYTNGIIIGGKNSPYGDAVQQSVKNAFAPRLGFAWDPTNTGKMSVRGGFGMFYDSPAVNSVEQFQPGNPPFVSSTRITDTNMSTPASGIAAVNLAPPFVGGVEPNWKQPYSMMGNLDVQYQFTPSTMFDIGYYTTQGRHLIGVVDINQPLAGAFQSIGLTSPVGSGSATQKLNQIRPYLGYDAIDLFEPVFTSNYNGLQAEFQKHFSANSLVAVNYTWSHALGTATNDYRAPQDSRNIRGDYGNLDYDRRHMFNASYVYTFPFYKDEQGFAGHALGGWEASGIVYLYTGSHLSPSNSRDPAGLGLRDANTFEGGRPDQIGDPNSGAPHTIAEWFNTAAFADVPAGQIRPGDAQRGSIVGPGYARWDASLFKNTKLSERFNLQFRAESFNVLNHTNFNNPASANLHSSLNGKITTARDPRQIQLALKLIF